MGRPLLALIFAAVALSPPARAADPWAFRPIVKPAVPAPADAKGWARTPVDRFVLDKLTANGLRPAPEAERRVLARRLSLDLTGLPPTPAELLAFLGDGSPDAYEKLVDRLLASPRHGERWARHWLDVAHYADSHGHDQDRPRPNAYPYRDYLIRAFNDDLPYAKFVRQQVAGDVLYPDDSSAIAATGFLAAGPWDESGLRDINENSADRLAARYLDRDDVVSSTMSAFAGLTAGCARCHDHKFDPISQSDYYALQAVFAGIDKGERSYDADPATALKRHSIAAELAKLRAGPPEATPERLDQVAALTAAHRGGEAKWHVLAPSAFTAKGGSTLKLLADGSVLSGGPRPERDTYSATIPVDSGKVSGLRLEVLCDDSLPHRGPGRQDNGNLHLSEVRVSAGPKGRPAEAVAVKIKAAYSDFDQTSWGVARAIDGAPATAWGIYPEVGKPHSAVFAFAAPAGFDGGTELVVELDQSHGAGHLIGRFRLAVTSAPVEGPLPPNVAEALKAERRTPAQESELVRWVAERRLLAELAALPAQGKVYCGSNKFPADGSFRPAAKPHPVHLLKRGEPSKPGELATPGTVSSVPGLPGRFKLGSPDDEGSRRAALAEWLADAKNPLTWRVIVNRVWHYHFGRGIVDTPNDFGAMGGPPSHPELLDWLAADFRDTGGSLKKLHKLIVTSATYRQSAAHDPAGAAKDADNRLLWRMNRGKLDAESLRDAVLQASGRLDLTMFGPPSQQFVMRPGKHVTPEADYEASDVDAPAGRRRAVYRFIFRTQPDPMLAALDCPDASQSAPARTASHGPTQALVLWNNKFMLRQAEHLAAQAESTVKSFGARIAFVSRQVLGREPSAAEAKAWGLFAAKHGLPGLCRVLFNSSEFVFID